MPVPLIVGAIIAGTATAVGSNQAAKAEEGADNQAINYQKSEQQLALNTNQPTRMLGTGADNLLAQAFGYNPTTGASTGEAPNYSGFINNPGTQFAMQQGQQAQNRTAASGGNLYSSNNLAQLGNIASGTSLQNYNNYINSLEQAAQIGGGAQNSSANNIVQTGQGVSNSYTNQGQAAAAGAAGVAGGIAGIGSAIAGSGGAGGLLSSYFGNASGVTAGTAQAQSASNPGYSVNGAGGTMFLGGQQVDPGTGMPMNSQAPIPTNTNTSQLLGH